MKIDELKKINAEFSWENPIDERDKDENTALHLACGNNHKKAVRVLVEAGASVDAVGEYGYSPLHSYARYNNNTKSDVMRDKFKTNSSLVCSRKPSKGDADPSDSNIKKIIKGKARPYWNDVVIEHIFESMKCFQMQAQKCPW